MLPINYDHSDLVKQLCDVGRQFSRCKTVEERFLVYETYLGLVDSYFTATGKEYCNKKLYRSFVKEGENFFFEMCASNFNNFVINKDFHANLMLSCYAQLDSFFQDFCESSYCGRLEKKKLSPINEEIDEDCALLMKFFREEAPELCSLYQMVVDSGNLYAMGEDDWLREGQTGPGAVPVPGRASPPPPAAAGLRPPGGRIPRPSPPGGFLPAGNRGSSRGGQAAYRQKRRPLGGFHRPVPPFPRRQIPYVPRPKGRGKPVPPAGRSDPSTPAPAAAPYGRGSSAPRGRRQPPSHPLGYGNRTSFCPASRQNTPP